MHHGEVFIMEPSYSFNHRVSIGLHYNKSPPTKKSPVMLHHQSTQIRENAAETNYRGNIPMSDSLFLHAHHQRVILLSLYWHHSHKFCKINGLRSTEQMYHQKLHLPVIILKTFISLSCLTQLQVTLEKVPHQQNQSAAVILHQQQKLMS